MIKKGQFGYQNLVYELLKKKINMKIHKFENLYPRTFWVVVMDEEDPIKLLNKFYFFVNLPGWNTINKSIEDD